MTSLRRSFVALGLALTVVGLVLLAVPAATRWFSLPPLGVGLLGIIALVQGVRSLQRRRLSGVDGAETPDRETRVRPGRPGDDFDEQVAALAGRRGRRWTGPAHERLQRRLHDAAVEAVARRSRLSPEAARERVAAGTWTDDSMAAWFLGGPEVPTPPWPDRVQAVLAGGTTVGYYARRTADAVVRLREVA